MGAVETGVRKLAQSFGFDIVRHGALDYPPDIDAAAVAMFESVRPYTMTGIERIAALRDAVQYIVRHKVPGDIVECGVWKGGSMMAIAKTLLEGNSKDRMLFLFDTFEGMPPPSDLDKDLSGQSADQLMQKTRNNKEDHPVWAIGPLDGVKNVMRQTGYDPSKTVFVQGKVEQTIPQQAPSQIALLRLDTDWYESTYHELTHLYPRLSVGGVLIIDDYGHWQGARRAVDQYFDENHLKLLLNRIDYTARIGVKME